MAIPLILFYFVRLRRKLPFRPILVLFGLFITACGWTHFMGYYTFYTPIYRLDGLIKLATAVISWVTVFALVPIIPRALAMRNPADLEQEIAARKEAEAGLQKAHDELEQRVIERTAEIQALNADLQRAIAETHHRVKNNLQVVSALLEMQMDETPDAIPRPAIQERLTQIKSIALVHDLLARNHAQGQEVDAMQVLTNLLPLLAAGMQKEDTPSPIRLEGEPGSIDLPTKAATGLALVVTELVSNAVKHASPRQERSTTDAAITVRLTREPYELLQLVVEDNGPGFPEGFDADADANLGLELVASIVANDLLGEINYGNRTFDTADGLEGGRVVIVFPARPGVE
ncbi:MAG: signal transduction histidine kinase [Chthonomonadaceae bacterium]|nr:signal transduction histidine kinase [Chthonomonadaceae bacterium]